MLAEDAAAAGDALRDEFEDDVILSIWNESDARTPRG